MKVLYLIDALGPGGAERSLAAMAPGLARLSGEFVVGTLYRREHGLEPLFDRAGIQVVHFDATGRVGKLAQVVGFLRNEKPDVVHTTLYESDVLGRLAAALMRVPVVTSYVSTSYGTKQENAFRVRAWKLRLAQGIDAATARAAALVHCNGEHLAPFVAGKLRVPRERIVVVPRGRSAEDFATPRPDDRRRTREALGVDSSETLLLALARHVYAKGVDVLLEAVAALPRDPRWKLVVAGRTGSMTEVLDGMLDSYALRDRVTLLGAREDVPALLAAADLLVAPSRWEGFCGAVLEGMAVGLPVVGSDVPGISEVLGPHTGFLANPDAGPAALTSQITRALEARAQWPRIAAASRERFLENFTIDAIVPQMYENLYLRATA